MTCSVEECDRPHTARGWCQGHYDRWRDNGDVHAEVPLDRPVRARLPRRRADPAPVHAPAEVVLVALPSDIAAAVQLRARTEGVPARAWVARALGRELAR